ncbi:Nodulation protein NolV [Frankliniella fusca]|uniref:Nodulation protein NolV n=1 Tax=Frankliniella fusca TaxID=407009 RepID=A0AAE1HS72_9NEOP|nr:Nodulation protein NolV [Frankliniella fusca]KAK3926516.1 Nodulation protein NolV [Frankliniella fusca]
MSNPSTSTWPVELLLQIPLPSISLWVRSFQALPTCVQPLSTAEPWNVLTSSLKCFIRVACSPTRFPSPWRTWPRREGENPWQQIGGAMGQADKHGDTATTWSVLQFSRFRVTNQWDGLAMGVILRAERQHAYGAVFSTLMLVAH